MSMATESTAADEYQRIYDDVAAINAAEKAQSAAEKERDKTIEKSLKGKSDVQAEMIRGLLVSMSDVKLAKLRESYYVACDARENALDALAKQIELKPIGDKANRVIFRSAFADWLVTELPPEARNLRAQIYARCACEPIKTRLTRYGFKVRIVGVESGYNVYANAYPWHLDVLARLPQDRAAELRSIQELATAEGWTVDIEAFE